MTTGEDIRAIPVHSHRVLVLPRWLAVGLFLGLVTVALVACAPLQAIAPRAVAAIPLVTPIPDPPQPSPTPALPAEVGPRIPHTTVGRDDCRACHLSMWPMPVSHETRSNQTCQTCHIPTSSKSDRSHVVL